MKSVHKFITVVFFLLLISLTEAYSQNWAPLGAGTGWGDCVAVYNNELYAGGRYGILKWDGSSWQNLGVGVVGEVKTIVVFQNKLIVGGSFIDAGNLDCPYLAMWDGTNWNDLGGTTNSIVQSLAVWNNKLIIGGYFTQCENLPAKYIVQYDGNNFSTMGTGMGGSQGQVMALTSYNGDLYAGGFFSTAGGVAVNHLAKWNGSAWSAVGSGVSGIVYALGTHNNNLVIGGLFTAAGGVSANAIALYDGTSYSALGSGCSGGFYPYVFSVLSFNGELYVAGMYTIAGGQTVNGIAKWNGNAWSGFNGGFYNGGTNAYGAYGICIFNNNLVATGIFNTAGGVGVGNIAIWEGLLTGVNNNQTVPDRFELSQNYPNPFNPTTKIGFSIAKSEDVKLTVHDITGREAALLVNEHMIAGVYEIAFDASKLSSGVYFYTIKTNSFTSTKKMILTK
jgi:trimeric autotransporter adhesin